MGLRIIAWLVLCAAATGCSAPEARATGPDWPPAVQTLPSPAAPGSAQPQLTVSSRGVLLSWIEQIGDAAYLKFAERSGAGWTKPRVAASGSDWFVNWADVPSVIRLANGALAAHWLQKSGADTYAYDVRLSFSTDEGRTWSAAVTPHHDATKTEHGFASLFQMPDGGLGLVWLDGREMGGDVDDAGHARGAMTVRSAVFDERGAQRREALVDARVCECCPTAVAVTADGPIAAFRNRSEDEIRDIYVARLEEGTWSTPRAVHDDGWKIAACPVNGPALSARGRQVAAAWFTAASGEGRAFVAFSTDAGRTFGNPIRVDDGGSLGRVDVEMLDDGHAVASYIEFAEQRAQFRVRRIHPAGARSAPLTIAGISGARASGYPRIARHGEEYVFAWTQSTDSGLRVQTAVGRFTTPSER